jgi:hypothetical protein
LQRVGHADFINPVRQALIGRRPQTPGHQRVKAPAIRQLPDRLDRRLAVSQRAADARQLALVKLPAQDAVEVPAEGHLLDRNIDMLARSVRASRIMRRQRPGSGHHVGMEGAGIERFLDRGHVWLTRHTQRTAHRRRHQFPAAPA